MESAVTVGHPAASSSAASPLRRRRFSPAPAAKAEMVWEHSMAGSSRMGCTTTVRTLLHPCCCDFSYRSLSLSPAGCGHALGLCPSFPSIFSIHLSSRMMLPHYIAMRFPWVTEALRPNPPPPPLVLLMRHARTPPTVTTCLCAFDLRLSGLFAAGCCSLGCKVTPV